MRVLVRVLVLFGLLTGCDDVFKPRFAVQEASGVTRYGRYLLIVGDEAPDGYFTFPVTESGTVIPILPDRLSWVGWRRTGNATDCESIDVLADGRVVVLSEDLRALVGEDGVIARYAENLAELAKRGLEGLAVLRLAGGSSRVAVIWEGGSPSAGGLRAAGIEGPPPVWLPRVLVHDIERGEKALSISARGQGAPRGASRLFPLDTSGIPGTPARMASIRAPDLVWHRDRAGQPILIVLLSGRSGAGRHDLHWLQRFDLEGRPIGEPADFKPQLPPRLREDVNWEGLGWFEAGKRLVTIHDTPPGGHPTACVLDIPESW
jgi:hypothetical protein